MKRRTGRPVALAHPPVTPPHDPVADQAAWASVRDDMEARRASARRGDRLHLAALREHHPEMAPAEYVQKKTRKA